jgi:SAM-dependent methyltransferase
VTNETMREIWSANGVEWVRNERIVDTILAPFAEAVLRTAELDTGNRVLDIGCGSGTLLRQAVELGAEPVGVDISEAMVGAARERVPQATVLLGDAQTVDLGSQAPGRLFDRVVSRFGVMFFDDPVAAFTNIRESTAPGATMTFACWRDADNPMFTLGTSVLTARLEELCAAPDSAAPGPQAFRSDDRVRNILADSGWSEVVIEAFDGVCDYSIDGSDGVEERLAMVLASTTGRQARAELEPRLGAQEWAALVENVRAELRGNLVDGVLKFTGRGWIVTATNPA